MAQKNESDGELSREMELAWQFVEQTGTSVFLTGKAGTGKTTFLRYVKEHTSKTCVVTAPTGVAAINARGVTLHSFFQLPPTLFVPGATVKSNFRFSRNKLRIIRALDLLIIDDLGTELTTEFVRSAFYQIVNTRLMTNKKTIISTNLSPAELSRRYGANILSRIEGAYRILPFFGDDIRKQKK